MGLELPTKPPLQRIITIVWELHGKVPFIGLMFIWPNSDIKWGNPLSPGFPKRNRNYVTSQPPEVVIPIGTNKKMMGGKKTSNNNLGNMRSVVGFEKLWHIPGDSESQAYVQGYAYSQKRHKEALFSHLWLTSRTWRLRQSCKLLEHWKHTPIHAHIPAAKGQETY